MWQAWAPIVSSAMLSRLMITGDLRSADVLALCHGSSWRAAMSATPTTSQPLLR
jgi:hypothetical protein